MKIPSSDTIEGFKHLLLVELCEALKLRGITETGNNQDQDQLSVPVPVGVLVT